MNKTELFVAASLCLSTGCGGEDVAPSGDSYSYRTTSNVGDLSTWTIEGNLLHVEWQDIAPITGDIEKVYTIDAICGTIDADFGNRTCLVDGDAICTDGTVACAPGDGPQNGETFTTFEVPGMALIVNVEDTELHAGFAAGACADLPTDDYSFVNLGFGQRDIFGLFRTDANFSTVHHMDFGFSDAPENQLRYVTGDVAGLVAGITANPCENGVRELVLDGTQDKMRLVITEAGHFLLDKPEGQGGLIAINGQNAAVSDDFANKQFGGIAFPDDRAPELISLTTGEAADGRALITGIVLSQSGDILPDTPVYINDGSVAPSLNGILGEEGSSYASNQIVIDGSYAGGASEIPGLFEIDGISGDETAIVGVGARANGKTMLFGAIVNEFDGPGNALKGNFILFEK